ncbi:uncharacterized protein [Ambystoma mexicanum]|uniref:uncharacterized protein n=1 Tax=Ambystoma mexicanum TaxID=8296 RepID=UPI0037E8121B
MQTRSAGTSSDSDLTQQSATRVTARGRRTQSSRNATASTSGTQPPATPMMAMVKSIPAAPKEQHVANEDTPAATSVTPISVQPPVSDNDAASVDSAPGEQGADAPDNVDDGGNLTPQQVPIFSLKGPHRPYHSHTPSLMELSARLLRIEEHQANLTQLVEQQLQEPRLQREEARLQQESSATSVRRLSRAIGRFATATMVLSQSVREGNNIMSNVAETMLVAQQAFLGNVPPANPAVPPASSTPSSSVASSPRRRSSRLSGPYRKDMYAHKCGRK